MGEQKPYETDPQTIGILLAAVISTWLIIAMSGCVIWDAYCHRADYQIPNFLIDLFVHVCEMTVGGIAIGTSVGFAIRKPPEK